MRLRLAALFAGVCVLLSGCSGFAQGTEALMRPPKLSTEQQEIYAALSAAVGDDIVLKYPGGGEHRSAFVMYDIDLDGEDEIIVFYAAAAESGDLRINILDREGGEWYSVFDSVGLGPEIDSISFNHVTNSERINLLISFELLSMQQKILGIYSYDNGELEEEFVCDYTGSLIQDFDGDGLDELFLLYNAEETIAEAMYVDTPYPTFTPTVMSKTEMSTDVKQYVQILAEPEYGEAMTEQTLQVTPNSYKLYIDGVSTARGNYTTEIVRLKRNGLVNLLVDENHVHKTNWRNVHLLTQDRNNDGIYDVPRGTKIADWPTDSKEGAVSLIEWCNYIDGQLLPTGYTLVGRTFDFSLDYPSAWGKSIAVKQSDDGYEWRLYRYIESKRLEEGGVLGDELLRIRVYSNSSDFFDEYSVEGYEQIGRGSAYTYYAYIPERAGQATEYDITFEQLSALFHITPSEGQ